jgi:pimeloyl-ACP methyl ester carboxylesterase
MAMTDKLPKVLLVPGGVNPGAVTYGPLLRILDGNARCTVKELDVYAADAPPPDYTIESEAESIGAAADAAGFAAFHLVGYSGGGAAALVFTALHPQRVLSLGLTEPAWIGNEGWTPGERQFWAVAEAMRDIDDAEFMRRFASAQMADGVAPPPPPPGPEPEWLRLRPAGLRAMMHAFERSTFDVAQLRGFDRPVYYALGGLSAPIYTGIAQRLAGVFGHFTLEVYRERSHMDPPHRAEPQRYARALERLWADD